MRTERWWSVILTVGLFMALNPLSAQAGPNGTFAPQQNRQAFTQPQPRPTGIVSRTNGSNPRQCFYGWNGQPHQGQQHPGNAYGWNAQNRQWQQPRGNAYGWNGQQRQWQHPQMPTAGMITNASGTSTAMPTDRMIIGVSGTSREMPTAEMITSARGNSLILHSPRGIAQKTGNSSRPMAVSIIILVLLIIMPAIRHRLNLPILPPGRQAITIIPPSRRVRLARSPVFATPMLPGMPLSLKANRLQG